MTPEDVGGRIWSSWLASQARERETAGLTRRLQPRAVEDAMVDLAGNDYLGLARHPVVTAAAAEAVGRWGAGAGASRLVTGTLTLHADLEDGLAVFAGWPAGLVFSSGYTANLSAVAALAGRDAVVISDEHSHASLIDAARLSRAEVIIVAHRDVAAVAEALRSLSGMPGENGGRRALVLTESVYSVLGDAAPLSELAAVCTAYDALLVVDEAHGLGVAGTGGRGLVAQHGLAGHPHVVVTATLSKALGSQGGAVLAHRAVVEHLVNRARPFIYDTALAPAAAAGALAALRVLADEPGRPALVADRVARLAARLGLPVPAGAVLSVPMDSPRAALAAQAAASAAGVRVGCFRPPSVPDGISRLRITCSAGLTEREWGRAAEVVAGVVRGAGRTGTAEVAR